MDTIDNINRLLKERGMSGAELSRSLGLSTAVYSQWNKKKTRPSNKTVKKIAEFFDVPVSDLTGETDEKKPTVKDDGRDPDFIKLRLSKMSVEELRSLMGDIAAEMAGRVKE